MPGVTGKFGLGVQNKAGQRLIEFHPRPRELRAFFSCMAWRAIPGPLSKRKRRLDSLEAAQGAPRDPRRDSRGERPKPHSLPGTYLVLVRDGSVPSALLFVSAGGSTK